MNRLNAFGTDAVHLAVSYRRAIRVVVTRSRELSGFNLVHCAIPLWVIWVCCHCTAPIKKAVRTLTQVYCLSLILRTKAREVLADTRSRLSLWIPFVSIANSM